MISDKQLEANRANAQKSTGPRTEAGKKRSSLNGLRHGLTGQVHLLPEEDAVAFKNFTQEIVESLDAVGAHEIQLAQSYAGYQWRINRIAAVESTMFTLGLMEDNAEDLNLEDPETHNAVSYAKTFRDNARAFDRLSTYNQRLESTAAKVLKQFREVQAARKTRFAKEIETAAELLQFNEMQEERYDPKSNGFALTVDQIENWINLRTQKEEARHAKHLAYNLAEYHRNLDERAAA